MPIQLGFHEPTISGSPRAVETRIDVEKDFREVGSIKQFIFGNDPSDDYSLKLTTTDGKPVVIRPEDAKALLKAAELAAAYGGEITLYEGGKAAGNLDPAMTARVLAAFK